MVGSLEAPLLVGGARSVRDVSASTSSSWSQLHLPSIVGHVGSRSIGYVGSFALAINVLVGPGMMDLPRVFQSAGYLPCALALTICGVVSALCVTLFCDVHARLPHYARAGDGSSRLEYADLFGFVFGRAYLKPTLLAFVLCNATQAITSIVVVAQVADQLIAFSFGQTYALEVYPIVRLLSWREAQCARQSHDCAAPFTHIGGGGHDNSAGLVLTLGYALMALLLAPIGFLSLEEGIRYQIGSFVVTVALVGVFAVYFYFETPDGGSPAVTVVGDDMSNLAGVSIFNFALCTSVTSWMNEKRRAVSVNRVVWSSTLAAVVLFACIGFLGATSMHAAPDNMLVELGETHRPTYVRIASYTFGLSAIGFGVPLSLVIVRYNLQMGGLLSAQTATVVACLVPWLVSWPLYRGHAALDLISWAGLGVNGLINFCLPLLLALRVARSETGEKSEQIVEPRGGAADTVRPLPALLEEKRVPLIVGALLLTAPTLLAGMWVKGES